MVRSFIKKRKRRGECGSGEISGRTASSPAVRDIMVSFDNWCDTQDSELGAHSLKVLSGRPADLTNGRDGVASIIPGHYATEEHIARNLAKLGKMAAAEFILQRLPTSKSIRSGDLGEILATDYIAEQTPYTVPIKRLRWKDHRNTAMRGDDVIGIINPIWSLADRALK